MDNIDKLRKEYCKENGLSYLHIKNGEYANYISWLEKKLVKNHGVSHHVSEMLIWTVKNSQNQVWSTLRSEEKAKEILKQHQNDHPNEYFYIEREEI